MEITITLNLPEDFVRDAREFGVLEPDAVVEGLRTILDQRVMNFVNEEIHAYRAEKAAEEARKRSEN